MNTAVIQKIRALDNAFYQANAASFSETRQHAWPGWDRVLASLPETPATVLDMACGNARFKSFAERIVGDGLLHYYGVDSCPDLLPLNHGMEFQCLDIIDALVNEELTASVKALPCELTVCFGFAHHVPSKDLRKKLMDALIDKTVPGGTVALSFWQFARDPKMHEKAIVSTEAGCAELELELNQGDYLLGWKEQSGAYRYCHSFTDDELDEFAAHCEKGAQLIDRFRADGHTGEMNGYLVFRKLV